MGFKPGQSGNPRGRPVGRSRKQPGGVTEVLQQICEASRAGHEEGRLIELLTKLADMACDGDLAAIRTVLAYLEGNPVARVVSQEPEMAPFTAEDAAAAAAQLREFRQALVDPHGNGSTGAG